MRSDATRSQSLLVVYNCFFAEIRQAKRHRRDVMFHAVEKVGPGLLRGAFPGQGECYVSLKREGQIRKDRSWKTQVNIGNLRS